jgi:hypothetical protein
MEEVQVRHVFHAPLCGLDRIQAWEAVTGEPAFAWGHGTDFSAIWFGRVKRALRSWLEQTAAATVTVYHDGGSAEALAPLDPAAHKLLALHRWPTRWRQAADWYIRCTGKVLVASEEERIRFRSALSWVPERYIGVWDLTSQLEFPSASQPSGSPAPQRTGIWLHGLPWRERGNRLRSLADRWDFAQGELEFVVDGNGRPPAWSKKAGLRWTEGLPLSFAMERLHCWDSVLLLDDWDLRRPWLAQALANRCFPLVPHGSGEDFPEYWTAEGAPARYEWGEPSSAQRLLDEWRALDEGDRGPYLEWLSRLGKAERSGRSEWQATVADLASQRESRLRKRKAVASWMPIRFFERTQRLRCGG